MNAEPINLFWTGGWGSRSRRLGWDSTFRLCSVLLLEGGSVQPYYVLDTDRPSVVRELRAMEAIRVRLSERSPNARLRFLPTLIRLKGEIRLNSSVTAAYRQLSAITWTGIQYEWLCRFADEVGLADIEVCLIRPLSHSAFELTAWLVAELEGQGHQCRMRNNPRRPELELFRSFRFPTIHLSKLEMRSLACQHGFSDILEMTWFCHTPMKEGRPCGQCTPCQIVKESGLSERLI
jgi:hypothetical protein